ncbi:L-proline dehydrogenase /delta-1-pyrroline-5-carboxylate dehydrogenase [Spirosomataceae bacterium TFI 002]|nr:L-proline dehydrogenase /delta-1-pyrroline-5-carboxylate dehydrogenase [Spirosomataceae bacterium TFI 002]
MPVIISEKEVAKGLETAKLLHDSDAAPNLFTQRMGPIVDAPESKNFLIKLMDVAFRSSKPKRVSDYVLDLINSSNYQGLFTKFESLLVGLFKTVGHWFPFISVPLMLKQIKQVTGPIVFFVGDSKFKQHAKQRNEENVRLNVNLIGEALIGEKEAEGRLQNYIGLLNEPEVDYISIKISTIYSQITSLAYEHTVEILTKKLTRLYQEVLDIEKNTGVIKFINLDMEEYRDLPMTIDTFINTLSLPQFKNLRAGIVLQAYLPDTYGEAVKLKVWAKTRVDNGGAPIKIRVVKGANLEMEKTESSLEHWELATYDSKKEADANYKKVLFELLDSSSAKYVNVGIASHNVFDLGLALNRVKENNLEQYVDFEMLEGMANDLVIKLLEQKVNVLLYTPIVKPENYNSAIAYLVRRLDEGTQDGNFLKEGIGLKVDSSKWKELEDSFLDSIKEIPKLNNEPHRKQDRANQTIVAQTAFHCVANTDWTLAANRKWIATVKERWQKPTDIVGAFVPVVGEIDVKKRQQIKVEGWNGNQPWEYEFADSADYTKVVSDSSEWYNLSVSEMAAKLRQAAVEIEKNRGDLIGVAVTELGKTIAEVDVEVSEAIDFANYYAQSILDLEKELPLKRINKGINLVLSPWNFPVAIPIGGVFASLAAGKRVILKPSTNAAATAYLTCKCLWDAGIPKSAVAFLPALEESLDPFLSEGNTFDAVILTGGTDTAKFLLNRNPGLKLYAETGGKNATIITALADRDQGIKNVVQSAFGNAGQKCSATSLLVLEKEVFEDEHFKQLLKDATESKYHGNAWNYETQIGPLAVPVSEKIKHVLENTKDSEWLVKPKLQGDFMLSPGIKWGITKESYEYNNELFGPILSVICAEDLEDAISIVNGVDFGLTSGIESLSRDEIQLWQKNIHAGNLYANRSTTGAIVQRQPFGGIKTSSFGFGMKAGGVNYVLQFMNFEPKETQNTIEQAWKNHFSLEIDYAKIRGQHNYNRYLRATSIIVLLDKNTEREDLEIVEQIAGILGVKTRKYSTVEIQGINTTVLDNFSELEPEVHQHVMIRSLLGGKMDSNFYKICHNKAVHIYERKPINVGRLEWLNYLSEQNFSWNYHRYGNLLGEKVD